MKSTRIVFLSATVLIAATSPQFGRADSFGSGDNEFNIEFVTVGDPGNPPDTTGDPDPAGAVDYVYRIGKFEISRKIIAKVNDAGSLGLVMHEMSFVTGGNRPDMPATGLSWNEAARFVSWLNVSQGFPPAYNFRSQPGENDYEANVDIELWKVRELELVFISQRRGKIGQSDLWIARRESVVDEWGEPERLDATINSSLAERWPRFLPDGLELYFSRAPALLHQTGGDIYVTRRDDFESDWRPAEAVSVNHPDWSDAPGSISADAKELWFSSTRPKPCTCLGFFVPERASTMDASGTPVFHTLFDDGPPGADVTGASLSSDGLALFFSTSLKEERYSHFDGANSGLVCASARTTPLSRAFRLGPFVSIDSCSFQRAKMSVA